MAAESMSTDRRQRILRTALQLFAEKGYEDTSLQDIIDRAGVSKGGFYHHFHSKAGLVETIADSFLDTVLKAATNLVGRPDLSALEKLNEHIRVTNSRKSQYAGEIASILLEIYGNHKNLLLEDRIFRLGQERLRPLIESVIEQGVAEGSFSAPYPKETAELYLHLFMFYQRQAAQTFKEAIEHRDFQPIAVLKRRYAFVQDLLEHALGVEPGTLVLQEVAAQTLDALWQHYAAQSAPGKE